jgi:hypothetical protein
VFALPGDLEPGESEFSVMVQERDTLQPLLDAQVNVHAVNGSQSVGPVRATSDDTENKLTQNADLEFPSQGDWSLQVDVQREGQSAALSLPVRVAETSPERNLRWPYMVFAVLAGILALSYWRRDRAARNTAACTRETEVARR